MKTKTFILMSALILAIFMISSTSALTLSSDHSKLTFTPSNEGQSQTFVLTNSDSDGNFSIQYDVTTVTLVVTDDDSNEASFSVSIIGDTDDLEEATFQVTLDSIDSDFQLGTYSENLDILAELISDSDVEDTISVPIVIENDNFCEYSNIEDLDIDITDITTKAGFGDDDSYWYPGDDVEIEVEVSPGDHDIKNIRVDWCLYDGDQQKCVIDGDESDFDLDYDDDEETVTISFYLNPKKLDQDSNDYTFYVSATGTVDDNDAGSNDGEKTCVSGSESIDINVDNHFVILSNLEITPSEGEDVLCGSSVHITADVWNIGDDDEQDTYIFISNDELGISQKVDIGDIDSFDEDKLDFTFDVPEDAAEKTYYVRMGVYDEDDDVFQSDEDDDSEYSLSVLVKGGCYLEPKAEVSIAPLEDENLYAGNSVELTSTITNTGEDSKVFTVSLSGYSDWAELEDLSESTFILDAGESADFSISLKTNKDAAGENSFDIEVTSEDSHVATQTVTLNLEEKKGFWSSLGITGSAIGENNWYLWGIGALNIILIIIIIVVAIRVARS